MKTLPQECLTRRGIVRVATTRALTVTRIGMSWCDVVTAVSRSEYPGSRERAIAIKQLVALIAADILVFVPASRGNGERLAKINMPKIIE